MLKLILNYLSSAAWARNIVQRWDFARRTASRFVAGETLDQAVEAVKDLNRKGIHTTLDHLGENISSSEEAHQAAEEILKIIDRLRSEGIRSGVSVKLSQIGLVIDPQLCEQNLLQILARARELNIFVRVDMEDSSLTQATLDVFHTAYNKGFQGFCGVAIQAYLLRSQGDVGDLLKDGCPIRLCKGAYKEPRTVAFPRKKDVDLNFDRLAELMLEKSLEVNSRLGADGLIPPIPALATHDQVRVENALAYADKIGLKKDNLEFQMLHGIREDLQQQLVERGYPVRVYVPYGSEWYPYFVRRLAERPANLWFFLSNLLRPRA
jgi:proline dehydrogenase